MKLHLFVKTILVLTQFFCLLAQPIAAQSTMKIKHSCNFDGEEAVSEHYIFEASMEATKIVNTLMSASGLAADGFILKESDCKNALATTEGRNRYILYNPIFLQKFKKDAKSKWAAYCVLAHEIAHHLNNHDLETEDPSVRKRQELEADKFAGHWLFKMGANLEEAQAGINNLPLENNNKTHPPKNARLVAVTNGWTKAQELSNASKPSDEPKPNEASKPTDASKKEEKTEGKTPDSQQKKPENSAPTTGFRVIETLVRADPANFTGKCPQTVVFRARISAVGGTGHVSYRWLRSDGASAPVQTLTFDVPGSKDIENTWTLGGDGSNFQNFWQQLEIFDPVSMKSEKAFFTLNCTTEFQKQMQQQQIRLDTSMYKKVKTMTVPINKSVKQVKQN